MHAKSSKRTGFAIACTRADSNGNLLCRTFRFRPSTLPSDMRCPNDGARGLHAQGLHCKDLTETLQGRTGRIDRTIYQMIRSKPLMITP